MAVLIGSSSTGKTRACWEAVQPLGELGWRLWHPYDPTRVDAALAGLKAVGPRTVVWLNEAQHYLSAGEPVAAALHKLLTDPERAPVLVLGTLWPNYDRDFAAIATSGSADRNARVRELLEGRRIMVPDTFDDGALQQAARLAKGGDRLLAAVLNRSHGGRVAQYLAGAPELLRRWQSASPGAKAVLEVAVDARRLGVGPHLPRGLLVDAAVGYLHADDYDTLADDWVQRALVELAEPVHGNLAPLRRVRERLGQHPPGTPPAASDTHGEPLYRLADYLEQHGRAVRGFLCPPVAFWDAATRHLDATDEVIALASAAEERLRYRYAERLYRKAFDAGDVSALGRLALMWAVAGDNGKAGQLYHKAAEAGDPRGWDGLSHQWILIGEYGQAEYLLRKGAEAGHPQLWISLAWMRANEKDREGVELHVRRAADGGHHLSLRELAWLWEVAGDDTRAESLYQQAADSGDASALCRVAEVRVRRGDRIGAERLYRQAVDAGDPYALGELARMLHAAGDQPAAEVLARKAADAGVHYALKELAEASDDPKWRQLLRYGLEPDGTISDSW
jgi:TPR repeat protein